MPWHKRTVIVLRLPVIPALVLAGAFAVNAGAEPVVEGSAFVRGYIVDSVPDSLKNEDTIFLASPSYRGEYLVLQVRGLILDFRYSEVEFVDEFSDLSEVHLIAAVDSISDQTVVIDSYMSCGIPSEQVSWTSPAGGAFRISFSESGFGREEWLFVAD